MRLAHLFIACTALIGAGFFVVGLSQPGQSGPGAPLEGVVSAIVLLLGIGLLVVALVCFAFIPGRQVFELVGDQITEAHFQLLSKSTMIHFPIGSKLVGICHENADMASRVATKVELPDSCREEFLRNSIFLKGEDRLPHYQLGSTLPWWKRTQLKSRVDRTQHLPTNIYVECSLGEESGKQVVYVSWA